MVHVRNNPSSMACSTPVLSSSPPPGIRTSSPYSFFRTCSVLPVSLGLGALHVNAQNSSNIKQVVEISAQVIFRMQLEAGERCCGVAFASSPRMVRATSSFVARSTPIPSSSPPDARTSKCSFSYSFIYTCSAPPEIIRPTRT